MPCRGLLRNRFYDPGTRAFLSVDPLPAVPGTACAGHPYHYAGNDPVGSLDPLGLRPVTDADLASYTTGQLGQTLEWIQGTWASILGGTALTTAGADGGVAAAMLEPLTLLDPLGLQPANDQLKTAESRLRAFCPGLLCSALGADANPLTL